MIAAIVPLKIHSRRLPNKNFLMLDNKPLSWHIFNILINVDKIDKVYCYSSSQKMLEFIPEGVEYLPRPKKYDGDEIKANDLFRYAVDKVEEEIIILCQAPGPYVTAESIVEGLHALEVGGYDCSMSCQKHKTYAWHKGKPINYSPEDICQTQMLDPIYTETSGFYIFRKKDYLEKGTRITGNPYLVEVGAKEAIDIDNPEDFALARHMAGFNDKNCTFEGDNYLINLMSKNNQDQMIKHISFDLDGVLIDTIDVMNMSWDVVIDKFALLVSFDEYRKLIGRPFKEILSMLNIDCSLHCEIEDTYSKISEENIDKIKLYDGVIECIRFLNEIGMKVSIVTSKDRRRTNALVDRLLRDVHIDIIVCPEDVCTNRGKPNPDQLLLACIKAGVSPHETIFLGDMKVDALTSKESGTSFVYAGWGYEGEYSSNEIWMDAPESFLEYLKEMYFYANK